jgi:hypothetical protein
VAIADQVQAALVGVDREEGVLRRRVGDEEDDEDDEEGDAGGDRGADDRADRDRGGRSPSDRQHAAADPRHRRPHQPPEVEALEVVRVVDVAGAGRRGAGTLVAHRR